MHFFFLPRPKSVLCCSLGLGVHDIPQVLPAKIIDKQKKNNGLNHLGGGGHSLGGGHSAPLPPPPPVSYAYEFGIHPCPTSSVASFFAMGGGGGSLPNVPTEKQMYVTYMRERAPQKCVYFQVSKYICIYHQCSSLLLLLVSLINDSILTKHKY